MKHQNDFLTKLVASGLMLIGIGLIIGVISLFSGCATPPPPKRIVRCLTDPGNNSMHCDGVSIPWGDHFRDYVCHSLDDDKLFRGGPAQ